MSRTHVLSIPRSDDSDSSSFVLVHVTPSPAKKAKPLDVKLVATEGESPYVVALQHAAIADLKVPGSPCSPSEWEHILESVLLGREVLDDIQLTAALRSGLIQITVRKRAQGITQRLGTITLQEDEDEEDSNVTQWCDIAIRSREDLRGQLASVRAKAQELEQAVSTLSGQLEELISAKRSHEASLLDKFRLLLNEKKAKIREQQDVIRRANLDPDALVPAESPEYGPTRARAPIASPRSKRKTPADQADSSDGDDDKDGSAKSMDLDSPPEASEIDKDGVGDPSEDQQSTDDGDGDGGATASEPDDVTLQKNKAGETKKNQGRSSATHNARRVPEPPSALPSRDMPLTTRSRAVDKAPTKPLAIADAGSETESDDEL